jgi:radical SAM superfamily enzyme YgiQ (UPF0313 family)
MTVPQVICELENLYNHKPKGIFKDFYFFTDDNIIGDKKYAKELFESLIPHHIKWGAQCCFSIVKDEELLNLATKSGCRVLFIGFDSLNRDSLKSVKKFDLINEYEKGIMKLRDKKIMVYASFVYGFDYDSPDIFKKTVDFCVSNNVDFANFHILWPQLGTNLYNRYKQEHRLLTNNLAFFRKEQVLFIPKNMKVSELQEGIFYSYSRFYSLRHIIRQFITNLGRLKLKYLFLMLIISLSFHRKIIKGIKYERKLNLFYKKEGMD